MGLASMELTAKRSKTALMDNSSILLVDAFQVRKFEIRNEESLAD
jgi:hypothetical protein